MNRTEIQANVVRILGHIAPGTDPGSVPPAANLREELDLDSVDFLTFAIALNKELGVAVPEADYRHLTTLAGCLDYLEAHLNPAAP